MNVRFLTKLLGSRVTPTVDRIVGSTLTLKFKYPIIKIIWNLFVWNDTLNEFYEMNNESNQHFEKFENFWINQNEKTCSE